MPKSQSFDDHQIEEESSWRYPLSIFVATLILCAIFLYLYVGPSVDEIVGETARPTISDEIISIEIGDTAFAIPSNYTIYPKDRRNGKKDSIALYTFWPTMNGYSPARRQDFVEHTNDSRRIDVLIEERETLFSENQRLELLYLPHVIDKRGVAYDYGLSRFVFKQSGENSPTNGYSDKSLFIGKTLTDDLVVLFCYNSPDIDVVPEECWREYELSEKAAVKYIFKKSYLPEWQTIDQKIQEFVMSTVTSK